MVGAHGGLTQSGGGGGGAEGVLFGGRRGRCVSPWNGGFQPPPRAADGNFFGGRAK